MKITILGGGREIGANSYFLEWEGARILLDCGMHPSRMGFKRIPRFELIKGKLLDLVFISHSHLDHLGSLPIVNSIFKIDEIVTHEYNPKVIRVMLQDSVKIISQYDKYNNRFYKFYFSYKKVSELLSNIKNIKYNEWHEINDKLKYKLFPVGHVIGASGIIIQNHKKEQFVYTGDFSDYEKFLVGAIKYPMKYKNPNVLITESTNGMADYSEYKRVNVEKKMITLINNALQKGGKVLLPSFSLGKTQEIYYIIKKNYEKLKTEPQIIIVGMANKITGVYEKYYEVELEKSQKHIKHIPPNTIVIATNGMMAPLTPSYNFAMDLLDNSKNLILFTGYVAENSFAKKLLRAPKTSKVKFIDKKIEKNCIVEHLSLSMHASKDAIVSFINKIKPQNTLLVHGDINAINSVNNELKSINTIIPQTGESVIYHNKKIYRRMDMENYIITVGTSLYFAYKRENNKEPTGIEELLNFIKDSKEPGMISAEINTIERMKKIDYEYATFYFIASDTKEGRMCADSIAEYYESKFGVNTEVVEIRGLNTDAKSFEEAGLINFINEVSSIIVNTSRNVKILATGGYKAEIAYANVIGQLFGIEIYYIHEDFKSLIVMPPISIDYDMTLFDMFYNTIMEIIEIPEKEEAIKLYRTLPEELKILIKRDRKMNRYVLSPMGTAFLNYYTSDFWKMDKKTKVLYSEPPHRTIWGKKVESLNDVDDTTKIILNRIYDIGKTIIIEMKLKAMKKGKKNVEHHLKFEKTVRDNILSYWIVTNQGQQRLHIKTKPNLNHTLLKLIGKKIYE